jgi:hypothetical protein
MIKKCGWRECNNFFTVLLVPHRKTFCGRKCSRSSACENWKNKNPDHHKSKRYRKLMNDRKRWRYKNEPGYREKILEAQKERQQKLRQDPSYVERRKEINNRYNTSEKGRKRARNYLKQRCATDIEFKIRMRLRSRMYSALIRQKGVKADDVIKLHGADVPSILKHLEQQFKDGMSWDNYGEWEIDHIKPCAAFDLRKNKEQRECFHYTNLQPLWGDENRLKADKYENNT